MSVAADRTGSAPSLVRARAVNRLTYSEILVEDGRPLEFGTSPLAASGERMGRTWYLR